MSQLNQESNAAGIMNEQQLNQVSQALYNYCKVMHMLKAGEEIDEIRKAVMR